MAVKLFISPQQIAQTTIMGGNVDVDKFNFCIESTMISTIEPLLGSELYDKIYADWVADTLAGDYLTLFEEYVQPITKFESTANYIEISSYMLTNGGLYKHAPENAEVVDKEEAQFLAQKYAANAQMYILRFNKWICKNPLTEYKVCQDEVNADGSMKVTAGWYFGKRKGLTEDELGW